MNTSFFQELLTTIAERGGRLLERRDSRTAGSGILKEDCARLLSGQGEASGIAIARAILNRYADCDDAEKTAFFQMLDEHFATDPKALTIAFEHYRSAPSPQSFAELFHTCEPPRQELFRRLNQAPGGTAALVAMRKDLLARLRRQPMLASVDNDLAHLFGSWFNRGFLVLKRIDWSSTPAAILEKIIRYEAVHEIQSWDELRRRLEPADRRCFAFFHPALADEPLIFVEVALTGHVPESIQEILHDQRSQQDISQATVAVFYSISNCQEGLRGISFGHFLIKQVVEELAREIPSLTHFVTLSPAPDFMKWLRDDAEDIRQSLPDRDQTLLQRLDGPDWIHDKGQVAALKKLLMPLAAYYFLKAKRADGYPPDPVARFHLGNGARLERVNWMADVSSRGLRQAAGLMVNYRYDLDHIEENHELFANQSSIVAASSIRRLARALPKHAN